MRTSLLVLVFAACATAAFAEDNRSSDYDSLGYGGRGNDASSQQMRELEKQEAANQGSNAASKDKTSSASSSDTTSGSSGRNGGWQDAGASRK